MLRRVLNALLDVIAPPLCLLCGAPPAAMPWLCASCAERLTLLRGPFCQRCGAPRPLPAPLCAACPADWPRRLVAARAAALHAGAARELASALAHRASLAAAGPLGRLAAAAARTLAPPDDAVVVPVPLHRRSRRRHRGLDPAAEVARVVARALQLPLERRWLKRVRAPSDAYRSPAGHRREVRGAFRAAAAVNGRAILLVDVRVASGATLGSCARALGRRGAAGVWAVTATRRPVRR